VHHHIIGRSLSWNFKFKTTFDTCDGNFHPINPVVTGHLEHLDTKLKLYGQYLASSGHEYLVTMAFGGQKKAVLHCEHWTHICRPKWNLFKYISHIWHEERYGWGTATH
jgi:hypothetical protein